MTRTLCLLICGLSLEAQQYRAFWADAFHDGYKTPAQVDQMVADVALAKGNAIFIEVRLRGNSYYLKSLEPPAQDATWSPTFDALEYLIEKAHARGIEVHAWFPVTPLWPLTIAPPVDQRHVWHKHGPNAKGYDMWMTTTASGKLSGSLDPGHPDAMKYLADVIVDPARQYDLDGIHLDYIRYPEDDNYGWNPAAVDRFQRLQNKVGTPGAGDPDWSAFRRKQITDLVRQIYLRAYEIKRSVKVTAALITWGTGPLNDAEFRTKDAYSRVFQDWRVWLEEGIIDIGMPMNYFDDARFPTYLNRWVEFEKDRQYKRSTMIGLAAYLNDIPQTLSQMERSLAASGARNSVSGVALYSYASTNRLTATTQVPITPNAQFYKAVGDYFKDTAAPPDLPWKSKPERGHLLGVVTVEGGPAWLKDGIGVTVESDTGREIIYRTVTDGTGFFGLVDMPPDRYRVRLDRDGVEVFRAAGQDITPGTAVRFDIFLKDSDFVSIVPRVIEAPEAAAPGDYVTLLGTALIGADPSTVQVLVNGEPVKVFYAAESRIDIQLPMVTASGWTLKIRRGGMESETFTVAYVDARPVIRGTRLLPDGYLEIYVTGLGRTTGVKVLLNGVQEPAVVYTGSNQVNVVLPEGVTAGEISLQVAVNSTIFTSNSARF